MKLDRRASRTAGQHWRNPSRGQCNDVWRSPVETGRGQCKGVPVVSGEAPGENTRYRTLFGDRTLVVVAKAQVLGWTLAEMCATKYRFVNKPWRKTAQQNVGHWLNPSWWDLYSRGPVSDWWDLHVQPWTVSDWILTDENCAVVDRFLTESWLMRTVQPWSGFWLNPEQWTGLWLNSDSELCSCGPDIDRSLRPKQPWTSLWLNPEPWTGLWLNPHENRTAVDWSLTEP